MEPPQFSKHSPLQEALLTDMLHLIVMFVDSPPPSVIHMALSAHLIL